MGSRNSDGSRINQPDFRLRHKGTQVEITSQSGVDVSVPSVDTSVEREKFTVDGSVDGNLSWQYTRKIHGEHTSVSELEARDALGPAETITERKIFFLPSDRGETSGFADWNIFDNIGEAVGATPGTTDTDVTPSGTFDERPSYDG
jgi:hypothetical protein